MNLFWTSRLYGKVAMAYTQFQSHSDPAVFEIKRMSCALQRIVLLDARR
jgi:hypothetical protein